MPIKKYILIYFLFFSWRVLQAQNQGVKLDIRNEYLYKMLIKDDTSDLIKFQNFAINLFINGKKIDSSFFTNRETNYVGICLEKIFDSSELDKLRFNLYSIRYKDNREKDFHKSIYFGRGKESITSFFLETKSDNGIKFKQAALDSYLKFDSIPFSNKSYVFMKTNKPEFSSKFFNSDSLSTVIIADQYYAYMRQNGNYIIQIRGEPDIKLHSDSEELFVTDYFNNHVLFISVVLIDDTKGKPFYLRFRN